MKTRSGQTTAEYAIALGVVLAALVAMQVYVRRGINAQMRAGVDEFTQAGSTDRSWLNNTDIRTGDVKLGSAPQSQYEPYYAEAKTMTVKESVQEENINLQTGTIRRDVVGTEKTTRKANTYQKQRPISEAD